LRARFLLLGAWAVVLWWSALGEDGSGGDWSWFTDGADDLVSGSGLHAYAAQPRMQFGPLALLSAVPARLLGDLSWPVVSLIAMALGLVAIALVERTAVLLGPRQGARTLQLTTLVGGAVVLKVWVLPAVTYGHPDDVLAVTGVAVAAWCVASGRWLPAAIALGLAAEAKPWALLALPLAAAVPGRRVAGIVVAGSAAVLGWVPFVLTDTGTFAVGGVHLPVSSDSGLALLVGAGSDPAWARGLQLAVAWAVGGVAVARGRWMLVPALAFTARVALDPGTAGYYVAGAALGLLLVDAALPGRLPAAWTLVGTGALLFVPEAVALAAGGVPGPLVAVARLALLGALTLLAVRPSPSPVAARSPAAASVRDPEAAPHAADPVSARLMRQA
jgi:hypothetical protein